MSGAIVVVGVVLVVVVVVIGGHWLLSLSLWVRGEHVDAIEPCAQEPFVQGGVFLNHQVKSEKWEDEDSALNGEETLRYATSLREVEQVGVSLNHEAIEELVLAGLVARPQEDIRLRRWQESEPHCVHTDILPIQEDEQAKVDKRHFERVQARSDVGSPAVSVQVCQTKLDR